jgi:hypothetical protein
MFSWIQNLFKKNSDGTSQPPKAPSPVSGANPSVSYANKSETHASLANGQAGRPVQGQNNSNTTVVTTSRPPHDLNEAIRLKAYFLWEADGQQEGKAEYYWEKAVEIITQQSKS